MCVFLRFCVFGPVSEFMYNKLGFEYQSVSRHQLCSRVSATSILLVCNLYSHKFLDFHLLPLLLSLDRGTVLSQLSIIYVTLSVQRKLSLYIGCYILLSVIRV